MTPRRLLVTALATMLLVPGAPASSAEPSVGDWPVPRASMEVSVGTAWVRNNPMVVSALVASMGDPPPIQVADYLSGFGASAVTLWQDGPAELERWLDQGSAFISWLAPDGTSVAWDPFVKVFESTGNVLGGLEPDTPGRIGFQVGDEPLTVGQLSDIEAGIAAVRLADPGALAMTNFTFYAPEREAILDHWVSSVDGDIQLSSDYFLGPIHYEVLERFRQSGLDKGVPYWQYLNAYVGAESQFARTHTESDLRWQAMAGLVYGYTGHIWFLYQAAAEGHESATVGGGSALHTGVGDWDAGRSPLWSAVGQINRELANLAAVTQLTSTDVRLILTPGAVRPFGTEDWGPGAGGDPYLIELGPVAGEGPMDVVAGFFTDDDGERYAMVQNGRHTHSTDLGEPPLPSADLPGAVHLAFDFTGAPFSVDRTRLEYLDPDTGKVRVLGLTMRLPEEPPPPPDPPPDPALPPPPPPPPPPPEIYEVDVLLPPGGVFFFKYADTVPFRLGPDVEGVGLVDPATGVWYLREPGAVNTFYYGDPGDVPFLGDWDCDGVDTPGLFRLSDGFVYLRNSNTQGNADVRYFLGDPGDAPLVGDFNADGCDTVSVYRQDEARVFILNRLGSADQGIGFADFDYEFGDPGDSAFAADFDGDGISTVGLRRDSTGFTYLRNSHTSGSADAQFYFADPGDLNLFGDWDGNGTATPGVFRSQEARFYLRFVNDEGPADLDFLFGQVGWLPVVGAF
ncbi:MAG: hypothetical protein V3R84_09070 [Acidimicrobiia bacterium]